MSGGYKRTGPFEGMPGREAVRAQTALNNYRSSVAAWQVQAEDLPNYDAIGEVDLWDYIGYTDTELAGYTTYDQFKASIDARRALIDSKVRAMRIRHAARERKTAAHQRALIKTVTGHSVRGRPAIKQLYYGQYVYFAVCYNNGQGAMFMGYPAGGDSPAAFSPTDITTWSGTGSNIGVPYKQPEPKTPTYTTGQAKQHVLDQINRNRRRKP